MLIATVAVLAALLGLIHWGLHRSLRAPREPETSDPASFALPFETVRIPTLRGRSLFGWLILADGAAPSPAVIVLHGWGGNAGMMLPLAPPLHAGGYSVLLIDARNHGNSDADSFSSMPRFAEDLEAAFAWLASRPRIEAARIAVLGHSVGAAAALLAASREPRIAAVVSIAAFAHPREMMQRWLAQRRIPFVPLGWYVLRYVQWIIGYRFDDIAPVNSATRLRCPLLLIHGEQDKTVPLGDARRILDAVAAANAELMLVPGRHDELAALDHHYEALLRFLDDAMRALRANVEARPGLD